MELKEFWEEREKLNEKILREGNLYTKRFFALDNDVYKEMMGLVASIVLRCDGCIMYHIVKCVEMGITKEEFYELLNIAMVVGGSITIPHIRKAVKYFEEARQLQL
jgi:AhpD family alkylhydroperoxidase